MGRACALYASREFISDLIQHVHVLLNAHDEHLGPQGGAGIARVAQLEGRVVLVLVEDVLDALDLRVEHLVHLRRLALHAGL